MRSWLVYLFNIFSNSNGFKCETEQQREGNNRSSFILINLLNCMINNLLHAALRLPPPSRVNLRNSRWDRCETFRKCYYNGSKLMRKISPLQLLLFASSLMVKVWNIPLASTTIFQLYSKLYSSELFYSVENCSLYEMRERDNFFSRVFHNCGSENLEKLE